MVANPQADDRDPLLVALGQPLIAIPFEIDGREVEYYFADEASADAAVSDDDLQLALDAIGSWSDLAWDELEGALERNRHEASPTPPFEP